MHRSQLLLTTTFNKHKWFELCSILYNTNLQQKQGLLPCAERYPLLCVCPVTNSRYMAFKKSNIYLKYLSMHAHFFYTLVWLELLHKFAYSGLFRFLLTIVNGMQIRQEMIKACAFSYMLPSFNCSYDYFDRFC